MLQVLIFPDCVCFYLPDRWRHLMTSRFATRKELNSYHRRYLEHEQQVVWISWTGFENEINQFFFWDFLWKQWTPLNIIRVEVSLKYQMLKSKSVLTMIKNTYIKWDQLSLMTMIIKEPLKKSVLEWKKCLQIRYESVIHHLYVKRQRESLSPLSLQTSSPLSSPPRTAPQRTRVWWSPWPQSAAPGRSPDHSGQWRGVAF